MQIQKTEEMESFFKRCFHNIQDDRLNQFLDRKASKGNEKYLQRQLAKAGSAEFQGREDKWPSLFLSAEQWLSSPYQKAVSLKEIHTAHFSYEAETVQAGRLFNADSIQKDPEREFKDWMKLRAMDEDMEILYLYQDEEDWMMAAPSEAFTNDPPAAKAHGNVLAFGLGIGYFAFMAMQNQAVHSITVIEKSQDVIDMFQEVLLPQFPHTVPLTILQGDALDFWKEEYLHHFDCIYTDIWQSSQDGLDWMEKLLEKYNPPFEKADFWIEDSCLEPIRTVLLIAMQECMDHKEHSVSIGWGRRLAKAEKALSFIPEEIHAPDQLKNYLYDNSFLRKVLSQRI